MKIVAILMLMLLFINVSTVLAYEDAYEVYSQQQQPEVDLLVTENSDTVYVANLKEVKEGLTILSESLDKLKSNSNQNVEYLQWALIGLSFLTTLLFLKRLRPTNDSRKDPRPIIELSTLAAALRNVRTDHIKGGEKPDIGALKAELQEWLELKLKSFKSAEPVPEVSIIEKSGPVAKPEVVKINVLYFSSPGRGGAFNHSTGKKYLSIHDSVYKMSIDIIDKTKAYFEFIEQSEAILKAINFPEDYVNSVCDDQGTFNPKATKVKQVQVGKAVLRGNTWEVTEKAKIQYI